MTNKQAHDAILSWCRSDAGRSFIHGMPAMRVAIDGRCIIIDCSMFEPERIVEGFDWLEVHAALVVKGAKL